MIMLVVEALLYARYADNIIMLVVEALLYARYADNMIMLVVDTEPQIQRIMQLVKLNLFCNLPTRLDAKI